MAPNSTAQIAQGVTSQSLCLLKQPRQETKRAHETPKSPEANRIRPMSDRESSNIFQNCSPESLIGGLKGFLPLPAAEMRQAQSSGAETAAKTSAFCSNAVTCDLVGSEHEKSFFSNQQHAGQASPSQIDSDDLLTSTLKERREQKKYSKVEEALSAKPK